MDNKSQLVSIIIPLYNAENYIEETISSATNQTHQNIEIIVIDDHSTDNSYQIVSSIVSDKITLVKNPKKGACAARNYGFELSKGEFIQYLDADDLLSPNKIEEQLKLIKNDLTIASCPWGRFSKKKTNYFPIHQFINKSYQKPLKWLIDSWSDKGKGAVHSWLTPRNLIKKSGNWNEELTVNQDGEFFCRVLLNAKEIHYAQNSLVYYREGNPHSISQRQASKEKAVSLLKSFKLYETHVEKFKSSIDVKIALATNYLKFIYLYDRHFPDLSVIAWQSYYTLKVSNPNSYGSNKIKFLSTMIGFKKSLIIIRLFHKLKFI